MLLRKPKSFQPPNNWRRAAGFYAPITLQPDDVHPKIRATWCQGEWQETGFFCGTVQDTVDLYTKWQEMGYKITEHMQDLLHEQIRIAFACGTSRRKGLDALDDSLYGL